MSYTSHVSLIDLTKQLPFEIDEKLRDQLCFAETLVISCGHFEDTTNFEYQSESDWSCSETTESDETSPEIEKQAFEVVDKVEEKIEEKVEREEDDFHFYFFPDCTNPPPKKNSEDSIVVVNGLPQINTVVKKPNVCTCNKDGKCECHIPLPCKCGAQTVEECACAADNVQICTCHDGLARLECTCNPSDVCLCFEGLPRPVCVCKKIGKPCICGFSTLPNPVCSCGHKPISNLKSNQKSTTQDVNAEETGLVEILEATEGELDGEIQSEQSAETKATKDKVGEQEPCVCQNPEEKKRCFCRKDQDCICNANACVCDVQKPCICEDPDFGLIPCKDEDNKSVCLCPDLSECTCDNIIKSDNCRCFPQQCTCGDPDNCKCFKCIDECICEPLLPADNRCICNEKPEDLCICPRIDEGRKLKKVRAGKHGYRWCHDVDPRHTFFDYGYDMHDKIDVKEQEKEKFKILGLHDTEEKLDDEDSSGLKKFVPPVYKKTPRKPSIDCCSSVGGISISVETLGEDKDKFLIQVVSHFSKEGANTGSKLVSIVDCNLHTMEENRIEHITKKDKTKERRSYLAICESGYYNKVTKLCGDRHLTKRLYHSFDEARNFLLEGANVVLIRFLGLRRYKGNIKTDTLLIDGTVCESIYVSHGVSQAIVNGKPMFVVKIEHHIVEPTGFVHQTLTVVTGRGYIVSHEWANSNYVMHLNPLLNVVPEDDVIEEHTPIADNWRQDLQLLSDYLDFKSERSSEGARYLTENGALTGTIRDYLQALLLLKPHDALHFTRHYFGAALSALDLPHDEYFEPYTKRVRYYFFED